MLSADQVKNQSFTPTSFRRGYDEREVDDFLDHVVETLRYYEQGGKPGPQAPTPPPRPTSEGLGSKAGRWLRGDPPGLSRKVGRWVDRSWRYDVS